MKQRNPWKSAFLVLASGCLAAGTFAWAGVVNGLPLAQATEGQQETIVPSELVLNPTTPSAPMETKDGVKIKPSDDKPFDVPDGEQTLPDDMKNATGDVVPPPLTEPNIPPTSAAKKAKKTAKLVVHAMDGRTGQPLENAEIVLLETSERFKTDRTGTTPAIDAPVIREETYAEQLAQLHGQLGLIAYKNGYRDSITFGVRMHEGRVTDVTMWMYQITPGDRRVEPVFFHNPYHRLWLVRLADAYRSPTQPGEGQESPAR
ncbi:hypothetical protein OS242_07230 [Tumebacillus sp. DT12]|uniref:DUF1795 domain-containing protein n=1 Tax=Tumebacillus lacus TaxID=2995335 RepID=A0ABT3X1A7_9BACL|nr:hypothetical protein [Tumebacillus lacus]MCX7569753.1 hypothetical protein [Tumebacillus lacus]